METQTHLPIRKRKILKTTILANIIIFSEGENVIAKYVGGENIFISKN